MLCICSILAVRILSLKARLVCLFTFGVAATICNTVPAFACFQEQFLFTLVLIHVKVDRDEWRGYFHWITLEYLQYNGAHHAENFFERKKNLVDVVSNFLWPLL